jgi:flagellin
MSGGVSKGPNLQNSDTNEVQAYMTGATRPEPGFFTSQVSTAAISDIKMELSAGSTIAAATAGAGNGSSIYNSSVEFVILEDGIDADTDTLTVNIRAALTNRMGETVNITLKKQELLMGGSTGQVFVDLSAAVIQEAAREQLGMNHTDAETAFGESFYLGTNNAGLGFDATDYAVGDVAIVHTRAKADDTAATADIITVNHSYTYINDDNVEVQVDDPRQYVLNRGINDNNTTKLGIHSVEVNKSSEYYGETYQGSVGITAKILADSNTTPSGKAATFTYEPGKGKIASLDTRLYDIDRFWDSSGNFMLAQPKEITILMGNGLSAKIFLSSADTLRDLRDKLNAAIAVQLDQIKVVGADNKDHFVSYVTNPDPSGLEAMEGTFIIRSAVAGGSGDLTFIGDDAIVNALALDTIQDSQSGDFLISVTEVHEGKVIAKNIKTADNLLVGVIHENIDVEFNPNVGMSARWDEDEKTFKLYGGDNYKATTFVHIADNTMVFQMGANAGQDVGAGIGNMGSDALGLRGLVVTSNGHANAAIGRIDKAITRVSGERAKLGAIQNRIEHTVNNLSVTTENLTAAESRIRDVDMAKEMINFTKYSILAQAATSMVAQAQQLPQNALQLLRG